MAYWKRKTEKVIADLGGTIEGGRIGESHDYFLDAPAGQVWSVGPLHTLAVGYYAGRASWAEESWKDAYERVADGIEPCPYGDDCDICHPDDDAA